MTYLLSLYEPCRGFNSTKWKYQDRETWRCPWGRDFEFGWNLSVVIVHFEVIVHWGQRMYLALFTIVHNFVWDMNYQNPDISHRRHHFVISIMLLLHYCFIPFRSWRYMLIIDKYLIWNWEALFAENDSRVLWLLKHSIWSNAMFTLFIICHVYIYFTFENASWKMYTNTNYYIIMNIIPIYF